MSTRPNSSTAASMARRPDEDPRAESLQLGSQFRGVRRIAHAQHDVAPASREFDRDRSANSSRRCSDDRNAS
jgi:hypothetical protein